MSLKSVSRAVRVIGFVVSPLFTAPAAAAALERGTPTASVRSEHRPVDLVAASRLAIARGRRGPSS